MMYLGSDPIGLNVNHCRAASGVINLPAAGTNATITVTHGLNTKKIFFVAQLVTENHVNFDNSSSRYQNVLVYGATKEVLAIDTEQTYSYNGGNQVPFIDTGLDNGYPSGIYCYFPGVDSTAIAVTALTRPSAGVFAISNNEVQFVSQYVFPVNSRWIWRAYALD